MDTKILTTEDVLLIHEILVADFVKGDDPIEPPGIKSLALLESAVGRQLTSLNNIVKYPNPIENAATLMYGICCDHPFHNGNKRTALVAMLAHLDRNNYVLSSKQKDLYNLVLRVASHRTQDDSSSRKKRKKNIGKISPDEEVKHIANFIKENSREIKRGEKLISYRQLRRLLAKFDISLEDPKKNQIRVVRTTKKIKGYFQKKEIFEKVNLGSIPYHGEERDVGLPLIKRVRAMCNLSENDGIDSATFYDKEAIVDSFINKYRIILRRLARQ